MTPLVCLVPVRNAEPSLPAYLESAEAWCDGVVALDDGSTDGTGEILRSHPIVRRVLASPRRDGFFGWHDGRNRHQLLTAAGGLGPSWVLWLDVDERIDQSDADALRVFVSTDALRSCTYRLQVYRMLPDERFDPRYEYQSRLFHLRVGDQLRMPRFCSSLVPEGERERPPVETTLRIKHYGDLGDAGRSARVRKFREADPEGTYADRYERFAPLSVGPQPRWTSRSAEDPVLRALRAPARRPPRAGREQPFVVCLLRARDCASALADWFEPVSRVADAVIALDDGSSDATGDALRAEPLVRCVLANRPHKRSGPRTSALNRLLEAAGELLPDWILMLEADERFSADDALALRRFVSDEALSGAGYGFETYQTLDGGRSWARQDPVEFRLFAWEPDQRFDGDPDDAGARLPSCVLPRHRFATTIRLQRTERDPTAERLQGRTWAPRPTDAPAMRVPREERDLVEQMLADLELDPRAFTSEPEAHPGPDGSREAGGATSDPRPVTDRTPAALVSVVIPALNAAHTIDRQLAALASQRYAGPWEVVVADNGSYDSTVAVARRWVTRLPNLRVIDASAVRSASFARNLGTRATTGDFLLYLDADDVAGPGWLRSMVDVAPAFDLVGGPYDQAFRVGRSLRTQTGLPYCCDFLPFAMGGNVGIWREVLEALGGFNERYWGADDVEFSWRAQLEGFRLGFVPDALVHHRPRQTARGVALQWYHYGRADAKLYDDFRAHGVPPPDPREVARHWRWTIRLAGRAVRTPRLRRRVAEHGGYVIGQGVGWLGRRGRARR